MLHREWPRFKGRISAKIASDNQAERELAYQQLGDILRTCCLRRTKQTKLNGRPIVDLPARYVYAYTMCLFCS